jgi:hypothetical protein
MFSYVSGRQRINGNKNSGKLLAISIALGMRRYNGGLHRPLEHIQGFTRSRWMPPFWARACAASPQRLSWSTNLLKQHKTLTQQNF